VEATVEEIELAVRAFIKAVRAMPAGSELQNRGEWMRVRTAVEQAAPPAVRPDLYANGRLSDGLLLHASGLGRAAVTTAISDATIAIEFAAFCTRPAPISQDWILLDANLPPGLRLSIGDYSLETRGYDDLVGLYPLPCLAYADGDAAPMPPRTLSGAAFLRRMRPERRVSAGTHLTWHFDTLIEVENWIPLLTLALWSPGITRAEAAYEVEPGRRVSPAGGRPVTAPNVFVGADGVEEEFEDHIRSGISISEAEIPAFTAFTAAVVERVDRVITGLGGSHKGRKKLARRLQTAAGHLLRAAHRTYGPEDSYDVLAYEKNEVLLRYVIAMEALLADDRDHLDLSRKVEYRAATLFATDEQRIATARLVKNAYAARSSYVHGDEVDPDFDLDALRVTARQVLLRWLVLAAGGVKDGPAQDPQAVASLLDRVTLSDGARREQITGPLRAFFAATPASEEFAKD